MEKKIKRVKEKKVQKKDKFRDNFQGQSKGFNSKNH